MGASHARHLLEGRVPGAVLGAVCDTQPERACPFAGVRAFTEPSRLIRSGCVDAVLIATPHLTHVPLALQALRAGLHILVEKPIAVEKAAAERLIEAHQSTDRVFAVMFNQRTDPKYLKVRDLLAAGEIGPLQRLQWTITDWFRTDAYYASSPWRARWATEGGGVLMNQAPHNLDLLQWLFGMPTSVRAFCGMGRRHAIEVEDEVTAYLEYDQGATGVFITSTGESPGVNRLEAVGDKGRVLVEGNAVTLFRNDPPAGVFRRESKERFAQPKVTREEWTFADSGPQHLGILQNFAEAILRGAPLVAPGPEGLASIELANAMVLSSVRGETVSLPIPAASYRRVLRRLIRDSAAREARP